MAPRFPAAPGAQDAGRTAPHLFRRQVRSPGQSQPCGRAPGALPGALLPTLALTFTKVTEGSGRLERTGLRRSLGGMTDGG